MSRSFHHSAQLPIGHMAPSEVTIHREIPRNDVLQSLLHSIGNGVTQICARMKVYAHVSTRVYTVYKIGRTMYEP